MLTKWYTPPVDGTGAKRTPVCGVEFLGEGDSDIEVGG